MIPKGKALLAYVACCAWLAVTVHAENEDWQSGRRNGTVHGPGTLVPPDVRFALLQSFGVSCDDDADPNCAGSGADHIAAGAGLRRAGTGTIRLRGAPVGATLEAAFLYVGLLANPGPISLPDLAVNGWPVTARRIARYGQHCWEIAPNSLLPAEATLYRARIDPFIIHPDINGDYLVTGVPSAVAAGDDPFRCEAPGCNPQVPLAQGATLVVVWRHKSVSAKSRVYIHEATGIVPQLTDSLVVHQGLLPAGPADWASYRFTSIGGDGQTRDPDILFQPVAPISTHLDVDGTAGWIRGPLSMIEPDADWTGSDGGSIPQLWDTRITTVYRGELGGGGGFVPPAQYSVFYETTGGVAFDYDCVNPSVHVLSLYAPN